MFPKVKVCSEIIDSNNMRFMQFRTNDQFSLQISKREKVNNLHQTGEIDFVVNVSIHVV